MESFDSSLLVKEVHEITETLVKIRAGTLSVQEFDSYSQNPVLFAEGAHYEDDDDYYCEDYGEEEDDYDYGITDNRHLKKAFSKKVAKKITNKHISNVLTAQVKRKC